MNMTTLNNAATFVAKNWKTSVQGACSCVIAVSASSAFMGALSPKHAAIVMSAAGAAKAILGLTMKDAKS